MRFFLAALTFLIAFPAFSQIKAITETGDEVLLHEDGTWVYLSPPEESVIESNERSYEKPDNASFLVKSKITGTGIWLDPKEWTFNKAGENEDAEYFFEKKGEDLFGMLISERTEIPLETMRVIAFENAKSAAPDIIIEKQEFRIVNGLKVLLLQMTGTIQGIRFTYYSYYYSDKAGTTQFITYTSENLFKDYRKQMEEMLNGFVLLDK